MGLLLLQIYIEEQRRLKQNDALQRQELKAYIVELIKSFPELAHQSGKPPTRQFVSGFLREGKPIKGYRVKLSVSRHEREPDFLTFDASNGCIYLDRRKTTPDKAVEGIWIPPAPFSLDECKATVKKNFLDALV